MTLLISPGALLGPELEELTERLRRVTVRIHARARRGEGMGSGVLWSRHGLVVTNAHVARASRCAIELHDGREAAAELVARDERRDLAVLRLEAVSGVSSGTLPQAAIGDPRALRVGELVVAVGNPLGVTGAVSAGVIHALPHGTPFVRTDVRLAPGNSGGPLATMAGEVVGINAMIVNGLGVAIASHVVERFLREQVFAALGAGARAAGTRVA